MKKQIIPAKWLTSIALFLFLCLIPICSAHAQDNVTGSFEGQVKDSVTGSPIPGVTVRITNQETGVPVAKQTDSSGRFYQNLLPPGEYTITILKQGYLSQILQRSLPALRPTVVLPPVPLVSESIATATVSPTPDTSATARPTPTTQPSPGVGSQSTSPARFAGIKDELNIFDARRGGTYSEKEVQTLPLGGTTLTRTFDELGLFLPGVAPPPQTLGNVAGPGVGAGVGSAGQFSVNGMRSRANNFTVDGSDNNDSDIGVRRQGFFALVPQPIESIREFQMITLLAPAQYGRNIGAQVNAISKSGGNQFHGTLYGSFNSSQLNALNIFDTANGTGTSALRSQTGQAVLNCTGTANPAACITRNTALTTTNQSGGEDSFTLGQAGFVLGGPIKKEKAFFFVSYESQFLNATKEASFAVPTVDRRGIFNSGATGFFIDCLTPAPGFNLANCNAANRTRFDADQGFPTSLEGDEIFSLFPFPNNPGGVYGANTFTEILPASARGNVVSGKYDQNFNFRGRPQTFTARYNFTQDWRDIPVTGGALFSSLRPRVRTQNFSTFLTSELSNSMSNVLRLSYGRTRLVFDELRNPFLIPSQISPTEPFLLNARRLINNTLAPAFGVPNTGPVLYSVAGTVECGSGCFNASGQPTFNRGLDRVGQINISGFSPVGVDVNYFPQRRVNNTYQVADSLGYRTGNHSITVGVDIRRVELNSDLPRNSRTLLTYNSAPELDKDPSHPNLFTGNFVPGIDFAAAGAPSGAFLSLARTGSAIGLRYHEWNVFGQDQWRIRPNLSVNFGLRYEYNTPPKEVHNLIENTFNAPETSNNPIVADLAQFLAGRRQIFDPDRNNFGPRIGIAFSPDWFGQDRSTVIRAGFGLFYDQIPGAVVSQSRNVFPNFVTLNAGGFDPSGTGQLVFFNPARGGVCLGGDCVNGFRPLVQPGTLNSLNRQLTLAQVINVFASGANFPNPVSITLPERNIKTPSAEHYAVTFEQQLNTSLLLSVGYVGTRGHNLIRASTPNLGPNNLLIPAFAIGALGGDPQPSIVGRAFAPGIPSTSNFDRPFPAIGPVYIFKSSSGSSYDALQLQLRGRYNLLGATQFQVNYTYGKATDDASDFFDLAGAPALPQSVTSAGELGPSNFDARHRVSSNYISDFSSWGKNSSFWHAIFNGLEIAGTGTFQSGQPFTVNSIFDVNLDGNLTDRPNSTSGIVQTGDRSQPLRLTVNPLTLLAPVGQNGQVPRNSFRSSNLFLTNAALIKTISFSETRKLVFRAEAFNLFNRSNYGIPTRFLEFPSFGKSTDTVTPNRRIQFGLKLVF